MLLTYLIMLVTSLLIDVFESLFSYTLPQVLYNEQETWIIAAS